MALESNILKETIIGLMDRGADSIRIGKATTYNELTVEEMQKMNQENGLEFSYEGTADMLTITRDL